jgi:hypothetical protein
MNFTLVVPSKQQPRVQKSSSPARETRSERIVIEKSCDIRGDEVVHKRGGKKEPVRRVREERNRRRRYKGREDIEDLIEEEEASETS